MSDGEPQMADEQCEVMSGGCDEGESSEPIPELSLGRVGGQDSNRVIDDSTKDKIGVLSHGGTDAADRPGQSDGVRQSLPGGVKMPQKAPNEANLKSEQGSGSQQLKSRNAGAEG